MKTLSKAKNGGMMSKLVCALRHRDNTDTLAKEVHELAEIVQTMGQLFTDEQRAKLRIRDRVETIFDRHDHAAVMQARCGTLGGFGTEEVDEWERTRH
jgi:hypothetical protein